MASTYQYWRLYFNGATNGGGSNVVSIAEWNFYDGNNNAISRSGGTASASQNTGTAGNAFDGNSSTIWSSTSQPSSGSPQWLQYQFSSAVTVSFIAVQITNSSSNWTLQSPTAFLVQGSSDGSTWTTIDTYTGILWLYGASQNQYFDASTTVGNVRTSQIAAETALSNASVRTSQIAVETALSNASVRTSQIAVETVGGSNPNAKISQIAIEVLGGSNPDVKVSQIAIEVMYPYVAPIQPIMECLLP